MRYAYFPVSIMLFDVIQSILFSLTSRVTNFIVFKNLHWTSCFLIYCVILQIKWYLKDYHFKYHHKHLVSNHKAFLTLHDYNSIQRRFKEISTIQTYKLKVQQIYKFTRAYICRFYLLKRKSENDASKDINNLLRKTSVHPKLCQNQKPTFRQIRLNLCPSTNQVNEVLGGYWHIFKILTHQRMIRRMRCKYYELEKK